MTLILSYKIQETSGAAMIYCPYIPLAVSGANVSIAPASPPPTAQQIDDTLFQLNGDAGNAIAVWVLENIPKEFRKVSHFGDFLRVEISDEEYAILFKLRWL